MKYLPLAAMFVVLISCGSKNDLPTVENVDLDKYQGTWYDLGHLPKKFQSNCKCVTAEYTAQDDYIKVVNTCIAIDSGDTTQIEGKAFVVDGSGNSKLRVQFFWPFKGDYYIVALEDDYSYAMVGSPDRGSLWLISREPYPAALVMKKYLNKAEELGFDTSELVYTDQSCHVEPIPEIVD